MKDTRVILVWDGKLTHDKGKRERNSARCREPGNEVLMTALGGRRV